MTEKDRIDLNNALNKAIQLVESTVSWVEARGFTNEQEYLDFEDRLNKISIKDHNRCFYNFKYVD